MVGGATGNLDSSLTLWPEGTADRVLGSAFGRRAEGRMTDYWVFEVKERERMGGLYPIRRVVGVVGQVLPR